MVDTVMIDPAYDGLIFNIALADVPERKSDLVAGEYRSSQFELMGVARAPARTGPGHVEPRLRHAPMILETPIGDDELGHARDLAILRGLL